MPDAKPDKPDPDVLTLAVAKLLESGDEDAARRLIESPEDFPAGGGEGGAESGKA